MAYFSKGGGDVEGAFGGGDGGVETGLQGGGGEGGWVMGGLPSGGGSEGVVMTVGDGGGRDGGGRIGRGGTGGCAAAAATRARARSYAALTSSTPPPMVRLRFLLASHRGWNRLALADSTRMPLMSEPLREGKAFFSSSAAPNTNAPALHSGTAHSGLCGWRWKLAARGCRQCYGQRPRKGVRASRQCMQPRRHSIDRARMVQPTAGP